MMWILTKALQWKLNGCRIITEVWSKSRFSERNYTLTAIQYVLNRDGFCVTYELCKHVCKPMYRHTHKCTDCFSQENCRVESSISCFSVCDPNWRNRFGVRKEEVRSLCPLNSAAKGATGTDSIWAVGICQPVTALSLPYHFTQVTSHLVLTTSDCAILSKIWMDNPEGLCTDYLQIEDQIETKQQHRLKHEGIKLQ